MDRRVTCIIRCVPIQNFHGPKTHVYINHGKTLNQSHVKIYIVNFEENSIYSA